MEYFLPILFISLLVASAFVFFALFPIKITWFYQRSPHQGSKSTAPEVKQPPPAPYSFAPSVKSYRLKEDDSFDDPEI